MCCQMGRELGFQNGRHTDLENVTKDTFCWKAFILKEELIRYESCGLSLYLHVAKVSPSVLLPI
jgi:hypothetical protein